MKAAKAIFAELLRDSFRLTYRLFVNIFETVETAWRDTSYSNVEHMRLNGGRWRNRWAQKIQHSHSNDVFMPFLEVFSPDLGIDIKAVKTRVEAAKIAAEKKITVLIPFARGISSLYFVQDHLELHRLLISIIKIADSVAKTLDESTRGSWDTWQEVSERAAAAREALEFEALEKTFKGLIVWSKMKLLQCICYAAEEECSAAINAESITTLECSKPDLRDEASGALRIAKHEVGKGVSTDVVASAKGGLIALIDQVLHQKHSAVFNEDTPLPPATAVAMREKEDEMRAHADSLQAIMAQLYDKLAELVEVLVTDDLTNEISKFMTDETSVSFRAREKDVDEAVKAVLKIDAVVQRLKCREKLQAPTLENPIMLAMIHDFKRAERVVQGAVGQLHAERTRLAAGIELRPRGQLTQMIQKQKLNQAYSRYRACIRAALIEKGIIVLAR